MWWPNALLLCVAVIPVTVKCHPVESDLQSDLEEGSVTYPADSSADVATVAVQTPTVSDDSPESITSGYLPNNHVPKNVPIPTTSAETGSASTSANTDVLSPFEPSPYRIEHSLGSSLTSSPPREDSGASAPRQTLSSPSPVRGDLPLDLDSEENTDEDIEYYFLGPTQSMLFGPLPVLPNSTAIHQDLEEEEEEEEGGGGGDSVDSSGLQFEDLPASLPVVSPERKEIIDVGNLLEAEPEFTDLATDEDITSSVTVSDEDISSSVTVSKPLPPPPPPPPPTVQPTTPSPTTASVSPPNTLAFGSLTKSGDESVGSHQNKSRGHANSFVDFANLMPTTELPEVITVFTSSPLQLHDKWTWFFLILRGDCHFVDLKHSYILFYDFVKSLSALLLYNREHIIVDSMTCSGRRMTVNMSIDSLYYPNCEKDLRTLLSHRNLRVDLHNASFYIHSYETKRSLLFETKEDPGEKKDPYVLYMTLGGVGISLVCIIFAGGLFAMYQCLIVRKNRANQADLSSRYYSTESPRSLCPKYEIDQSLSFSDQRTYSVNMYKSYTDLTAPDLYSHLGSPNQQDQEKEMGPNRPTILTKIPKEKNKKNKKKKKKKPNNPPGIYGLNDCETYQEFWSESITQTNEDFMTVRNLNTMTSSFKTNVKESDSDSLHPLLKKKKKKMAAPMPSPKKSSRVIEDFPLPPPPPPPPTTCPSSPVIAKGVLERMDQLISDTYSNSVPDVTASAANGYSRSFSNTTVNISSASSSAFPASSVPGSASKKTSTTTTTTTTSSSERAAPSVADHQRAPPPSTSASADNLCLTRITFMEMCVWPQHSNPQLSLEGTHSKDHLHLKYP